MCFDDLISPSEGAFPGVPLARSCVTGTRIYFYSFQSFLARPVFKTFEALELMEKVSNIELGQELYVARTATRNVLAGADFFASYKRWMHTAMSYVGFPQVPPLNGSCPTPLPLVTNAKQMLWP